MENYKCRACQTSIKPFIKFGKMPIANAFYLKKKFKDQYFYDMDAAFCSKCFCFQLVNIPDHKQMFHSKYAYFVILHLYNQSKYSHLISRRKYFILVSSSIFIIT